MHKTENLFILGTSSNLFYQQKFELASADLLFVKDIKKIKKLHDYLEFDTNNICDSGSTRIYYFNNVSD